MATIGRHVSKLSGYAPALPTPFGNDGNVDVAAFEQFCDRQIRAGATALVVCGTTGEADRKSTRLNSSHLGISYAVRRSLPPSPTRRSSDRGNVDVAAFEQFCDRQIRAGATALVVCGTTGEAPTLRPAEHATLIQIAVAVAHSRVPVIAGAGSNSTAHAIELTRDAEAAGADAILSVVPYYNRPTQTGLYEH